MTSDATRERERVLDGWRAVSILLVLAGHLLPLGPKAWKMNDAIAATGMVLFFILSGYLITTFLLRRPDVKAFLIRRLCRIVPLAWLYVVVVLTLVGADQTTWLAHLFFFANVPPFWLAPATGHLWSLCVEMHFYVGVALVVAFGGRRALIVLPALCLAVTVWRWASGNEISIVTWSRVDEILAGATLALLRARRPHLRLRVPTVVYPVLGAVLIASAHADAGPINYARSYIAASIIGLTLSSSGGRTVRALECRWLAYIATVSYALYVFHIGLVHTWLGSGDTLERYAKRPLLVLVLFVLAHLSTKYYEARWIEWGRQATSGRNASSRAARIDDQQER